MEEPELASNESIRAQKVKVLKAIRPLTMKDVVLGQYVGKLNAGKTDIDRDGYKDDINVPSNSKSATFATVVLHVDNERWEGVPFILRCGKAVNEDKDEIRLQFKNTGKKTKKLFPKHTLETNEIVIQLRPKEKVTQRVSLKNAGLETDLENVEIDLSSGLKFTKAHFVSSYERVVQSVLTNPSNIHFIGKDELLSSWQLFDPVLKEINSRRASPLRYEYGSSGPEAADQLCKKYGFSLSVAYPW